MAYAGNSTQEHRLATPNYSYEKRQRELAKKRKAEEKRQKKAQRGSDAQPGDAPQTDEDAPAPAPDSPAQPGN